MRLSNYRAWLTSGIALSLLSIPLQVMRENELAPVMRAELGRLIDAESDMKVLVLLITAAWSLVAGIGSLIGLYRIKPWAAKWSVNATIASGTALTFSPPMISWGQPSALAMYATVIWGAVVAYAHSSEFRQEAERRWPQRA